MKIRILTITQKSPGWIQQGYADYAKRLPASCALELVEIPAEKRTNNSDLARIKEKEGQKLLATIHPNHYVIALDKDGIAFSSEQLAKELDDWLHLGTNIDLLIGGPEGLSDACLQKAKKKWSLSNLTFPHILVKLILSEQIYRAWSILNNTPYHR